MSCILCRKKSKTVEWGVIFSDQGRTCVYSLARSMLEMCATGGRRRRRHSCRSRPLARSLLCPCHYSSSKAALDLHGRASVRPPLSSLSLSLSSARPLTRPPVARPSKSQYPRGLIMTRKVATMMGNARVKGREGEGTLITLNIAVLSAYK